MSALGHFINASRGPSSPKADIRERPRHATSRTVRFALDGDESAAMADYILNHCKNAEVSWYEGVGRAPFLEVPLRFNSELKLFTASAHR